MKDDDKRTILFSQGIGHADSHLKELLKKQFGEAPKIENAFADIDILESYKTPDFAAIEKAVSQMEERIKPRIAVISHMNVSKDVRLLKAIERLQNSMNVNIVLKEPPLGIDFPEDKIMVLKDPMFLGNMMDALEIDNLRIFENQLDGHRIDNNFPELFDKDFFKKEKPVKPKNFKDRPSIPSKKRRWKK